MSAPLVLLCALLAAPSPHLSEGIRLYKAQNYADALEALTRAIDEKNSQRDKASIHVYIGLIQFRFDMRNDASSSFERALDYDPKLEIPKNNAPGARRLFAKIKREKYGDDRPPKKRVKRSKAEPGGAKIEAQPDPPPSSDPPPSYDPPPVSDPPPSSDPPVLASAPPPPSVAPPPPPPPSLAPPIGVTAPIVEDSGPNLPAWISIGAGAAAVITAAALGGVSLHNFSTDQDEPFADDAKARFEAAVAQRNGAIIAGSIGAVGLGLGTALFLID